MRNESNGKLGTSFGQSTDENDETLIFSRQTKFSRALRRLGEMITNDSDAVQVIKDTTGNQTAAHIEMQNFEFVRLIKEFHEQSEYEAIYTGGEKIESATKLSNERVTKLVSRIFKDIEFKNNGPVLRPDNFVEVERRKSLRMADYKDKNQGSLERAA